MRFSLALPLALAASVSAQNMTAPAAGNGTDAASYATGLLAALTANNLTTLVTIATANAAALLPVLMAGNRTVFAPTNEAFAALPANVSGNATLVAQVVLYHILTGSFPAASLNSTPTIARSVLNSSLVALPRGQPQALVLTGGNGTMVTVNQALSNVTSLATATYRNLIVHVIPTVLTVPVSISATATAAGLTSLVSAVGTANLTATVDNAVGATLFAPSEAAFAAVASVAAGLNATTLGAILANHLIVGTVVTSNLISNGTMATSAGGQALTLSTNATGVFVTSGTTTARIIRTNVLVRNGVVHIIDRVLVNTASNPAAAASAASVAATATVPTATGSAPGATTTAPRSSAVQVGTSFAAGVLALAGLAIVV